MNKKQTIRLNESQFNNLVKKVVKESVDRLLKESNNQNDMINLTNKLYYYISQLQNSLKGKSEETKILKEMYNTVATLESYIEVPDLHQTMY